MSTPKRFFILDGVRRALACRTSGRKTIPAIIYREGQAPELRPRLKLASLYSPKAAIVGDTRFYRIAPPIDTPIAVEPLRARGQMKSISLAAVKLV